MEAHMLLIIGIMLLVVSIVLFFVKYNIYKNGIRVLGKVIDIKQCNEAILDEFNQATFITLYRPVIEFTTLDGEKITFIHNDIKSEKSLAVGNEIKIVYNRKKSKDFYVDDKMEFFRLPIILVVVSILFFAFSITLYLI
ncbi:hypothetical protein J2Z53_000229 [Clostridium moniliforme]|uniref:DUF3592 domain-containing protein n=1 Tax=Clostridium moniliforme TaxID=39489 RepID=A0ABS4EXC2_9CLOT|nr:DUF3592 domain-containing protein [Clostridium moniliforme]MBP1888650.1 hypothetical protein [Clostridium moniliforme]